jgi:dTDP-4-amino-4,6-dideoxygalactose transaminase
MSDVQIPLSEPCLDGSTRAYLEQCVATNFVSSVGPFVEQFERRFAEFVGARHAVACSTGTAALHMAMRLAAIGVGDEVWCSTLTFIASANPILYERGTPVLVDAEPLSWNIDPQLVVDELARRARMGARLPRAIEVVHILGIPAEIEPIADACERHGVLLIEDAAEALGARYNSGRFAGRHVGTIGRIGCYSFNGNKIVTTGGGGMLVTDDPEMAWRARHLTTQARLPGLEYRHDEVGYNYRLSNLAAALGCAQLEQLPRFLTRKREIADRYNAALGSCVGVTTSPRPEWAQPSHWLYTILVNPERAPLDRRAVAEKLAASGIQSRPIWSPLHTMPMYRDAARLGGGVAERLFDQGLSLPCSVGLTSAQQECVLTAIAGLWKALASTP